MSSSKRTRLCFILSICLTILLYLSCIYRVDHYTGYAYGKSYTAVHNDIANSTLGFEHIFAINAPWRTDRKDSLTLAAAESGISIEWIGGVNASGLDDRAYPQGNHRQLPMSNLGSWRAHMDVIRAIIEQNLTSALIFEDDVDWDPRIRLQLTDFGTASTLLPAMIRESEQTHQRIVPSRESPHHDNEVLDPNEQSNRFSLPLPPSHTSPTTTPYGTDWDVLWLGHCTASPPPYPSTHHHHTADRFVHHDTTLPLSSRPRTYHRAHRLRCTHAYAVTQRGARRIMYEHGMRNLDRSYDVALGEWCDGETKNMGQRPLCLSSWPGVFVQESSGEQDEGEARGVRGALEELVET